jgi:hypothetical protein
LKVYVPAPTTIKVVYATKTKISQAFVFFNKETEKAIKIIEIDGQD